MAFGNERTVVGDSWFVSRKKAASQRFAWRVSKFAEKQRQSGVGGIPGLQKKETYCTQQTSSVHAAQNGHRHHRCDPEVVIRPPLNCDNSVYLFGDGAMTMPAIRTVLLLAACLVSFSKVTYAQNPTTPNFSGSVADIMKVPIAEAFIWIHEESGRTSYTVRTNSKGVFDTHLPEGYYDVLISSPGFAPFCKAVWVQPGKPIKIAVNLKPDKENLQD